MPTAEAIREYNSFLLDGLSRFLCERPDAISADMVNELASACALGVEEAFSLLLAAECGLDVAGDPIHMEIYRLYFPRMARLLEAKEYRRDPYLRAVGIPDARFGAWELKAEAYKPFEAFVRDDIEALPDGRLIPQIGFFGEAFAFPAALERGREWMTVTPNEIATMRPAIAAARGRVLAYGLGLGYFAFMAARKANVESVTVVERDPSAIALFREHILPRFERPDKVLIARADAFDFAARELAGGGYDVVFSDLWHDPSDGVALYLRMKSLECLSPRSEFYYWIEKTLKAYM